MSPVQGRRLIVLEDTAHDGLVVDDYYKRGLAINQTLSRALRAE